MSSEGGGVEAGLTDDAIEQSPGDLGSLARSIDVGAPTSTVHNVDILGRTGRVHNNEEYERVIEYQRVIFDGGLL